MKAILGTNQSFDKFYVNYMAKLIEFEKNSKYSFQDYLNTLQKLVKVEIPR